MKVRTLFILGIVALLLASTALVAPAQSAPVAQTEGSGGITSNPLVTTQTAAGVAAYWTSDRLKSAIPLDIERTKIDGQAPISPASLVATGAPAMVAGNPPGKAPVGQGIALQTDAVAPAYAVAAWYAYPFPYTRTTVSGGWQNGYPFVTNGKLFFTQNGVNYVCSGTSLTSGGGNQRLVLTAAHCVHAGDNSGSGWSTNMWFCPAWNNGYGPWGCWTSLQNWTFVEWYVNANLKYDVAIIVTGDNSDYGYGRLGNTIGTQGLAWNQSYVQSFWEYGYPQAAPFTGKYQIMVTSSTAEADQPWSALPGPYTIGVGSDMTGGSSGGGWLIQAKLGNLGYLNGLNSYKYINPDRPYAMYGPYFDTAVYNLWAAARVVAP